MITDLQAILKKEMKEAESSRDFDRYNQAYRLNNMATALDNLSNLYSKSRFSQVDITFNCLSDGDLTTDVVIVGYDEFGYQETIVSDIIRGNLLEVITESGNSPEVIAAINPVMEFTNEPH